MTLKALLAILQAAILAAGLLLLGTLVVESLERSLRADADDLLAARAEVVDAQVQSRLRAAPNGASLSGLDLDAGGIEMLAQPGLLVEIWDPAGRRVAASRGLQTSGLPGAPEAVEAARSGQSRLDTLPIGGRERVRVLSRPVMQDGRLVAVIRVGEPLHLIDNTLSGLVRLLVVGGALVLLACTVATWIVVSRALEPLEEIAATAERIAATGDVSVTITPRGTTEVRRLGHAFGRMVQRLRHLLTTQRQLLADTSHELRNPLTVIRTDLDLLGRELDSETRQEVAGEAQAEAARMTRLVADLLLLARQESAARGPAEPVRLDRLVADVVDQFQQVAPDHEVTVGDLDAVAVLGDPDRLRQMVANLVENGVGYTPAGGHVTVDVRADKDGSVRLEVADDGVGIAPEHLPRVFDRFYRVDPSRGRSTGGTGLGLAIVKHVAESHGGSVEATSTPGVGSRFTVRLPTWPQPDPTADSSASAPVIEPGSVQAGSATAPSGRAADSRPAGTPPTTDHPAPRP